MWPITFLDLKIFFIEAFTLSYSKPCCGSAYVFGPSGSASRSVSHKCGSGSGSFHHQAKIVSNFCCFVTSYDFLSLKNEVNVPVFRIPICRIRIFGPLGSASGSVSQRYGSEDQDPHPHPSRYQNVTDPQHCSKPNRNSTVSHPIQCSGSESVVSVCLCSSWILKFFYGSGSRYESFHEQTKK